MRLSPLLPSLCLTCAALFAPVSAKAAVAYSYGSAASAYAAAAGQTVTVPLYLFETLTGGSTSLLASESGLFGAGITITRATSGSAAIAGTTLNPAFSGLSQTSTMAGVASVSEAEVPNATTGVAATPVSSGSGTMVNEVFLGKVSITVGTAATTFTLSQFVNGNGTTGGNTVTYNNFYDLDTSSTSPAYSAAAPTTFTVNAVVPEPTTLVALLGGGVVAALRRRHR